MSSVEDLGNRAYKKALFGDYKGAITILDKAIVYFRRDPRLYNNRSYCYFKLKDYKMALKDAELMVELFPSYARGHFRKAEALAGLKMYTEAETVLRTVLRLEPESDEAKFLLAEVQIAILCKGGKYWVQDAVTALALTDHDTHNASQFLKIGGRKGSKVYSKDEVYFSDEEPVELSRTLAKPTACPTRMLAKPTKTLDYDPYTDPRNPYNCNSIWVGNVTKRVTPGKLKAIFGKYGKFKDIIVHDNSCAFINFTDPKMAAAAMRHFPQHCPVEDTTLIIRYPTKNCKPSNCTDSCNRIRH